MHPLLGVLELGGVSRPIGSYGVFVALGILVAGTLAERAAEAHEVDAGRAIAAIAAVIGLGFASAWLTFLIVDVARTGTLGALAHGGGLVAFGAVPGAALATWGGQRLLHIPSIPILARALPGIAAGHALGRVGCFLGGCCYGAPFDGPWSVVYADPLAPAALVPGIARHPSPLYEALGLVAIGLAFALVPARPGSAARRIAAYVAAYCVLRFAVELTRGDAVRGVFTGGWSTSMALALAALAAALVAGVVAGRGHRHRA